MNALVYKLLPLCLLAATCFSSITCSQSSAPDKVEQTREFLGIPQEELTQLFLQVAVSEQSPISREALSQQIIAMHNQLLALNNEKKQAAQEGRPFPVDDTTRTTLRANMNSLLSQAAQLLWHDEQTAEQLRKASHEIK